MTRGAPAQPPQRVVSLVPSISESLFALGYAERIVGVTDWCVHPADGVAALPKLGGTKDPDLDAVAALQPDLVIANHEENTRRAVEGLEARALRVWVTYPRTVESAVALLRELAALSPDRERAAAAFDPVNAAWLEARAERPAPADAARVFCPIWREPWMSVGSDTYAGDLLVLCGGCNVFGERGDRRYPKVSEAEIVEAAPEVVLLPDEPYAFGSAEADALRELPIPAAAAERIHLIDGTLVSWYGPRIAKAIATLRLLLRGSPKAP